MSKLTDLLEVEGYDDPMGMLEDFAHDSLVPGICMNADCNCTYNYETDSSDGWCDECQTNSVSSIHILMGII